MDYSMDRINLARQSLVLVLAIFQVALTAAFEPACFAADQAVVRFLENPHTERSVVRLSDLIEVLSGNSPSLSKLLELPLGPAPRENATQTWHREDVMQHMELRGIHPSSIRWSGTEVVTLQASQSLSDDQRTSLTPAFVDERVIELAGNNVGLAIREYLNLRTGDRTDWRIDAVVPAQYAKLLQIRRNIASIGGGEEPWTGEQEFVLQVKNAGTLMSLPLKAVVELPPMVVIARQPIRRDQVLTAELLSYSPLPRTADQAGYFEDIDELVGKQLRRSISTGQAIAADVVGEPIVVQRSDLVEVESVAGNIVVRTSAKSLGSGAVGELIEIEMATRHRLYATVVGPARVRISAVAQRTTSRR